MKENCPADPMHILLGLVNHLNKDCIAHLTDYINEDDEQVGGWQKRELVNLSKDAVQEIDDIEKHKDYKAKKRKMNQMRKCSDAIDKEIEEQKHLLMEMHHSMKSLPEEDPEIPIVAHAIEGLKQCISDNEQRHETFQQGMRLHTENTGYGVQNRTLRGLKDFVEKTKSAKGTFHNCIQFRAKLSASCSSNLLFR